ncbi:MAG: hypothetical protein AAGJ86_01640 [Pseudomonadota bacterium]
MNASFTEKSVWVQVTALIVVLGGYFWTAKQMFMAGVMDIRAYAAVFTVSVVMLVIVLVAGHIVVAITSRGDFSDERDRLIAWRAEALSSWVMGIGILSAIFAMVFGVETVLVAHLLLLSLLLSEILANSLRILFYRRGV